MSNELLVKVYKVGFGDCIYVQIPDDGDVFTMLIDCGTSGSADPLEDAVDDIRKMLPTLNGAERRLDLLVVTHPHADHIKGFDPRWFKEIQDRTHLAACLHEPYASRSETDPRLPAHGRTQCAGSHEPRRASAGFGSAVAIGKERVESQQRRSLGCPA